MKNPSYPDALYMVRIKRHRAKQALSSIIERYGVISHDPVPGLDVILDYFTNMVYAIELLLKVMARDWDTGNSKYKHRVGDMYRAVFGKDYTKSDLLTVLQTAILDQKFLYEPDPALIDRVPEIEDLWDELKDKFHTDNWASKQTVQKNVKMPGGFGRYLANNVDRFYESGSMALPAHSREDRIQMHEADIEFRKREIARLRASEETLDQEHRRIMDEQLRNYLQKLGSLKNMMELSFQRHGEEISFGTWTMVAVVGNFLE